jgi:hypothetical protein
VVVLQMPGDCVRAAVEAFAARLFPQFDDQIDRRLVYPGGAVVRAASDWLRPSPTVAPPTYSDVLRHPIRMS